MNFSLQSDKVSLFEYRHPTDELWQLFRKTAIEPAQASSPDFASFSDECLLCARIVVNPPVLAESWIGNTSQVSCSPEARTGGSTPVTSPQESQLYREDGLIYLQASPANAPAGEANIGVIIKDSMRHCGYAREAVRLVLRWAFEELQFHRIQVAILDTPFKDKALRLFIGLGFAHEGTKRRAVYQPEGEGRAGIWKDVTYLAMLDTEWILRSARNEHGHIPERPIVSVWDEMFARHAREREELLRWEENHGRMTRSSSMETLRQTARNAALSHDLAYLADESSSISEPSPSSSAPPSPPNLVNWDDDMYMMDEEISSADGYSDIWDDIIEARQYGQGMGGSPLAPSPWNRILALPSIPSIGMLSEGNLQSPLTIVSPSSAECSPPSSPSPSPTLSSIHGAWSDSEDEANLISPTNTSIRSALRYSLNESHTVPRGVRMYRSQSGGASSFRSDDSWSDAQTSVGTSPSTWDLISNGSDRSGHGRAV